MTIEVLPISSLWFEKVHYYSVSVNDNPKVEFQDFHARMSVDSKDRIELDEIVRHIQRIGQKLGAFPQHFKSEDAAEALPPPYHFFESDITGDFGLRLYCIRICQSVVILLNGDRKTALKVKDCPNCYRHFELARKLAKRITEAIKDKDIELDEENGELIVYDDFEIIL